uniref:glutathione transferase n=1 Tax=Rhinopithecus bieti TaxID=61621 RepID=A0A2K6MHB7_RHIBE
MLGTLCPNELPGFPFSSYHRARAILRYIAAAKHTCCECGWLQVVDSCFCSGELTKLYSQFLGKRVFIPHILGLLQITFVDFLAYDVLDMKRIFEPSCLDSFPNLKDFISRFEVMPPSSFLFDAPSSVTSFEMLSQSWSYTKNNLHLLSAGFVPGTVPSTLYLLCGS